MKFHPIFSQSPQNKKQKSKKIFALFIFILLIFIGIGTLAVLYSKGGALNPYYGSFNISVINDNGLFGKDYELYVNAELVKSGHLNAGAWISYYIHLPNNMASKDYEIHAIGYDDLDGHRTSDYKLIILRDGDTLDSELHI